MVYTALNGMKPDLIIFGRSPFINEVDVDALLPYYATVGFNTFGQHYPVDYLFFYDRYYDSHPHCLPIMPNWIDKPGVKIIPRASDRPVFPERYQDKTLVVGFKYFTVSIAVNWAILKGFRTIYLVGVDHNEEDRQFKRFDGDRTRTPTDLCPEAHQRVKRFIEACARVAKAQIYQCNPNAKGWSLPHKSIEELYVKQ